MSHLARPAGPALAPAIALALAVGLAAVGTVRAQERPIDRWLVGSVDELPAADPLSGEGARHFPDRAVTVGPASWTLVREDGRTRFDFSERARGGAAVLAHVYLRAPADRTVRLRLAADACAEPAAWLNGQRLEAPEGDVRLARGWNALLVAVEDRPDCPADFGVTVDPGAGLRDPDLEGGTGTIEIQASRPWGVRPNLPAGTVTVGRPRIERLAWAPGQDRLLADLSYRVTAWGRSAAVAGADEERPSGPPAVDLAGEWELTLFTPTGIRRAVADFEMDEDGSLEGRLRAAPDAEGGAGPRGGRGFEGSIRDGWVSGREFGWRMELGGPGPSAELEFRGTVEEGELRGTIDFGGGRDFESRFDGRRPGAADEEDDRNETDPGAPEPGGPGAMGGEPSAQLEHMARQLREPAEPVAPAPDAATVKLRIAGEELRASTDRLEPGTGRSFEGTVPFRKLREAALRPDGVEAEVRWDGDDRELEGTIPATAVLEALHAPIALRFSGGQGGAGGTAAELRVPETLAGFTLRGSGGRFRVDGAEAADGVLCDPCERGRRLRIEFEPDGEGDGPSVRIVDPGWPDVAGEEDAPAAQVWLRALEGDNRRYRELVEGASRPSGS